jgi:hypothetical protein
LRNEKSDAENFGANFGEKRACRRVLDGIDEEERDTRGRTAT